MTDSSLALQLVLEDGQEQLEAVSCNRFAIIWQGREIWVQPVGDQLLIGVDVEEGDTEYANVLVRPQATNMIAVQLEFEPMEDDGDHCHDEHCDHDHH